MLDDLKNDLASQNSTLQLDRTWPAHEQGLETAGDQRQQKAGRRVDHDTAAEVLGSSSGSRLGAAAAAGSAHVSPGMLAPKSAEAAWQSREDARWRRRARRGGDGHVMERLVAQVARLEQQVAWLMAAARAPASPPASPHGPPPPVAQSPAEAYWPTRHHLEKLQRDEGARDQLDSLDSLDSDEVDYLRREEEQGQGHEQEQDGGRRGQDDAQGCWRPAATEVVCSGEARKRGQVHLSYRARFFMLWGDGRLKYFKAQGDYEAGRRCLGLLDCRGARVSDDGIVVGMSEYDDPGYALSVVDRKGRTLHLLFASWQDKDRWLTNFEVVAATNGSEEGQEGDADAPQDEVAVLTAEDFDEAQRRARDAEFESFQVVVPSLATP